MDNHCALSMRTKIHVHVYLNGKKNITTKKYNYINRKTFFLDDLSIKAFFTIMDMKSKHYLRSVVKSTEIVLFIIIAS